MTSTQKLNLRRTLLVGLAFMSISAFWQFYDQAVSYMLEFSFGDKLESIFGEGSRTFITNIIMSFDNILALFMLPLFGTLSDKTHTPIGRRTPYILGGTAVAATAFILLGVFERQGAFWPFFICLFVLLFAMSTYRSPAVALMPDVTPKPLRSKANAIINLMGTVGGVFALAAIALGVKETADEKVYFPAILAVGFFMIFSIAIFFLTVPEKKWVAEMPPEEEPVAEDTGAGKRLPRPLLRSLIFILLSVFFWFMAYNGATTILSRYCFNRLDIPLGSSSMFTMAAMVCATISYVPIGILSSRFGRKKVIFFGIGLMFAAFLAAAFVDRAVYEKIPFILYVLFSLVGIGWASINVNSFPMAVEIARGGDVGKYTGYYYTFSMAAQVFTPILSGALISLTGYWVVFPYCAVFMALAALTMSFVRHGDSKAPKTTVLESFAADD